MQRSTARAIITSALTLALAACGGAPTPTTAGAADCPATEEPMEEQLLVTDFFEPLVASIVAEHGVEQLDRVEAGVRRAAARWRATDGDREEFADLMRTTFVSDPEALANLLGRFEDNLEQILGHLLEVERHLREPTDLDRGAVQSIDRMFAGYDLAAHVVDDLFKSRIAFVVLLNFEEHTLAQKLAASADWSRDDWARARAADIFSSRVPAEIQQRITAAHAAADDYISNYNIHLHHVLDERGERLFPEGLKLISHWGLRDEIKAHYGAPDGLPRQRLIQRVMERIIAQEIPAVVIDNPAVDWDPNANTLVPAGGEAAPEPDTRYAHLLAIFQAVRAADPYHPTLPTYIQRKFERAREIPEQEVRDLLVSVLSAPVMQDVGRVIARRLGRPLEPFDVWYDGFSARGGRSQDDLDAAVRERYPTVAAFQADLPVILGKLGFDAETAAFLADHIVVDPSRGAGHAMGAARREDQAHLRTRFEADGMNYKGYNIAIHELGHNVEQVFSLNRIDHYLLEGVPNTAFTEGFAFAFQARDLELLGLADDDPDQEHLAVLDTLWQAYEISGVALVDIEIWSWMYAHPEATPAELKAAMIDIARRVWNDYFAPVFGVRDQPLLAIYSHIVEIAMYTPDYPLGLYIQFQMGQHFAEHGLAGEMERMCKLGSITPDDWMRQAVGAPISTAPLLAAGRASVDALSAE